MDIATYHPDPVVSPALHLEAGYSTSALSRLTGLSFRQLDYYDRIGVLSPSLGSAHGSGTRRAYSEADLARALLVATLRGFGLDTAVITRVLGQLPPDHDTWPAFLFISATGEVREYGPGGYAWIGVQTKRLMDLSAVA